MAPNGYAWWYLDALSDDGAHALVAIAFIGSVFSPRYYRARQRGAAAPHDFCAMNVALYGTHARRWALTEYGRGALETGADILALGPNALAWGGDGLDCRFEERGAPLPRRLRGRIRLAGGPRGFAAVPLTADGRHRWQPLLPQARVTVELEHPRLRWEGQGYFDCNDGDGPLADDVREWTWLRAHGREGALVLYDIQPARGPQTLHALRFPPAGGILSLTAPPRAALPRTGWRIARPFRADTAASVRRVSTLEDTPFYARSLVEATLCGESVRVMHESLSLTRFQSPWVRLLLPFRMRRSRA